MILCAINLDEESVFIEQTTTRNHTEKLLNLKTEITSGGTNIYVSKRNYPKPFEITLKL